MDIGAGNAFRFDLRHMAGNALGSGAAVFMMRVFFEGGGVGSIRGRRAVAVEADLVRGFSQLRVVLRAMHIVAGGTGDSTPVHDALHKVIALHAVLVRGAVGKIVKIWFAPACSLPASRNPAASARRDSPPANRRLALDRTCRMAVPANGTECKCRSRRTESICAGLTMLPREGCAACSLPGPWQRSQPTFHSATCLVWMS